MQGIVKLLTIFLVSILSLYGCGGGGSSSSVAESIPEETSSPPASSGSSESIAINPLTDLGLGKGKTVCFRLKSYNNVTESAFSNPICGTINDDHILTLSWSEVSGNINGYYVYFGTSENNATNFLADVIAS